MKKQLRKANGLALPTVVLFIIMMATVGTLMVVVSNRSMKMSNVTPTLDGHFYAAEAALNKAMPLIAQDMVNSPVGEDVAREIRRVAIEVAKEIIGDIMSATDNNARTQLFKDALLADADFPSTLTTEMNRLMNETPDFKIPNRGIGEARPTNLAEAVAGTEHFFLAVEGVVDGVPVVKNVDGFNVPAFLNLDRVGNTVIAGFNVDVQAGATNAMFAISPYVTLISEAGTVEISERIALPVSGFIMDADGNVSSLLNSFSEGRGYKCQFPEKHDPPLAEGAICPLLPWYDTDTFQWKDPQEGDEIPFYDDTCPCLYEELNTMAGDATWDALQAATNWPAGLAQSNPAVFWPSDAATYTSENDPSKIPTAWANIPLNHRFYGRTWNDTDGGNALTAGERFLYLLEIEYGLVPGNPTPRDPSTLTHIRYDFSTLVLENSGILDLSMFPNLGLFYMQNGQVIVDAPSNKPISIMGPDRSAGGSPLLFRATGQLTINNNSTASSMSIHNIEMVASGSTRVNLPRGGNDDFGNGIIIAGGGNSLYVQPAAGTTRDTNPVTGVFPVGNRFNAPQFIATGGELRLFPSEEFGGEFGSWHGLYVKNNASNAPAIDPIDTPGQLIINGMFLGSQAGVAASGLLYNSPDSQTNAARKNDRMVRDPDELISGKHLLNGTFVRLVNNNPNLPSFDDDDSGSPGSSWSVVAGTPEILTPHIGIR